MSDHAVLSKEWFDDQFYVQVPSDIRYLAESICTQFNIKGLSDPMYIANIIALETNLGDGFGNFNGNGLHTVSSEDGLKVSRRLVNSYTTSLSAIMTIDAAIMTIDELVGDARINAIKLQKILSGEAVVVSDEWHEQTWLSIPDEVVTIPNPNQVGILDCYLAGLTSHPVIAAYREKMGITEESADESHRPA